MIVFFSLELKIGYVHHKVVILFLFYFYFYFYFYFV